MKCDGEDSPAKSSQYPHGQRRHKEEKVLVVSLSNAVINPGTVVIKRLQENQRVCAYNRLQLGRICIGF